MFDAREQKAWYDEQRERRRRWEAEQRAADRKYEEADSKRQDEQREADRKWREEQKEADRKWREGQVRSDRKWHFFFASLVGLIGVIVGALLIAHLQPDAHPSDQPPAKAAPQKTQQE